MVLGVGITIGALSLLGKVSGSSDCWQRHGLIFVTACPARSRACETAAV